MLLEASEPEGGESSLGRQDKGAQPITIGAIQQFLDRCRDARFRQTVQQAQELSRELRRIRGDLNGALRQRSERTCLLAPNLNAFKILGVVEEERAHSRFLKELLDPRGTHGQGTLFLSKFLTQCGHPMQVGSWTDQIVVRREVPIYGGRLDLMIRAPGRFCVVIENKVNAPEDLSQLPCYRDWLRKCPEPRKERVLVFLTKKGIPAKNIREGEYVKLSYVKDIRRWVEKCRESIKAERARYLVDQYLDLLAEWRRKDDVETKP